MVEISKLQIPPPRNWQDFEDLCWDLWRTIWNDPETQKNGRQGQKQHGVDIYGRPDGENKWAGIQCKGKDNFSKKTITQKELKDEVAKAKNFKPQISKYIFATTGQRDEKIQELARKITDEHSQKDLFSVHVFFWEDILERLIEYQEILKRHYRDIFPEQNEIKQIKNDVCAINNSISILNTEVENKYTLSVQDVSKEFLNIEFKAELDQIRELRKENNPTGALIFLKNLKERIWSNAIPDIRYRILTNQGGANLHLHKYREAGKLFVEALQYNSNDDKAIETAAFGYLLLGELSKAKKLAFKVLEKNSISSRAYSIIIQATSNDAEIEKFISNIPDYVKETQDVAYVIGNRAINKGDLNKAKKWLEIAIENEIEETTEIKGLLGSILLDIVLTDSNTLYGYQLNPIEIDLLRKSVELCSSAWGRLHDPELKKLHIQWLISRGVAKRLLGSEDYGTDIETAFNLDPCNPKVIYFRALLDLENGESEKARILLKDILWIKETPEASFLYLESLKRLKKFETAIDEINTFLRQDLSSEKKDMLKRILISIYIDIENYGEAQKIAESRIEEDPNNIQKVVDASRVMRKSRKKDESILFLNKTKNVLSESSPVKHLMELADEYFNLELFDEAGLIYEKFVDTDQTTILTHKIVEAYYRCGEIGKAFEICKSLRLKYGSIPHISQIELSIYHEISDFSEAKLVCQEYITKFPDDFQMKLNLAIVNLRLNNLEEVDEFLKSSIDIDSLSFETGTNLANLFFERGLVQKSIEVLYEIRRKFFKNAQSHLRYIWAVLNIGDDEWLHPTTVGVDTVVWIDESGKTQHYILENRKDADIQKNELNLDDDLSQKILGKSVKDKISYKTMVSEEISEITKIMSKYIFAFQESSDQFNRLFPNAAGIWKISLGEKDKDNISTEGFNKIKALAIKNSEKNKTILEYYAQKRLTIGAIANNSSADVFDIWLEFTKRSDLGIYCAIGSAKETEQALNQIKKATKLIVDPISLSTMIELKVGDIIINNFEKLGIAQSTVFLLQEAIRRQKGLASKGFMNLVGQGENVSYQEVGPELIKKKLEKFEKMLDWVRNNCIIIPCKAALSIKRQKRKEYNRILGQPFIDTILISSEEGNILYSDDALLRAIAKRDFNVEGVWTQILLMNCVNNNSIPNENYNKIVIDLVNLHYHHTSIIAKTLIEAAKQANWRLEYPFLNVLDILRKEHSEELSAFNVSVDFTCLLWKEQIPMDCRNLLFLKLLTILTLGRWSPPIISKFKDRIINRVDVTYIDKENIIELIELWKIIFLI